jgi:ribose transport system permease protein
MAVAAALFAVVYGVLLAVSPFERSAYSIQNFCQLAAPTAVAAAGTAFVLITGGFDMSGAGVMSLTSALVATLPAGMALWLKLLLLVAIGAAVGLFNGVVVAAGIQPLAVTLAVGIALGGLSLVILPSPGGSVPHGLVSVASGSPAGVPSGLWLMGAVGAFWIVFSKTRSGVAIYAIGDDEAATALSGVNTGGVKARVYVIAGVCYVLAGLMLASVTSTGDPAAGEPYQLSAFAAMALGMVSFRGGKGSVIEAMLGAGTLTALPKLLFSLGLADFWVEMCQGVVILAALAVPSLARAFGRSHTKHREQVVK